MLHNINNASPNRFFNYENVLYLILSTTFDTKIDMTLKIMSLRDTNNRISLMNHLCVEIIGWL